MWSFKRTSRGSGAAAPLSRSSSSGEYDGLEHLGGVKGYHQMVSCLTALIENRQRHCRIGKIVLKPMAGAQ